MTGHPDPRRIERLEGSARREALDHLSRCEACRDEAFGHDPAALFALLAARPVPADALDSVSRVVSVAVRGGREIPRPAPPARLRSASAWVAAALLAAALLAPLAGRLRTPERPAVAATAEGGKAPRAAVQPAAASETIQTVDLTVGDTQLVMIFDPRLEL